MATVSDTSIDSIKIRFGSMNKDELLVIIGQLLEKFGSDASNFLNELAPKNLMHEVVDSKQKKMTKNEKVKTPNVFDMSR